MIHTVRHLPLVRSLSSAKKFKYIVIAPPFPLHLLSSLIGNCLKLPFGTQGRSWRLEANPYDQEMGGGEHSKVPMTRSPTGSCLVSKPFHFQINGGQGSRSNFPNISQAAESRAELRTQVSQLCFLMNWFHPVQLLNFISGSSTPCQDDILQFGESPWHFAPGKPASWRLKQKISSTEFLEDLTSLHFWLDELCCRQDGVPLAKILAFSSLKQIQKNTETEFGGNRKVALTLSRQRGEHSRLMPQELCPGPMRSLGAYITWGLPVRCRWWGPEVIGSWFSLLHCFRDSHKLASRNPDIESGSSVALRPSFWYVTTRGRVLLW